MHLVVPSPRLYHGAAFSPPCSKPLALGFYAFRFPVRSLSFGIPITVSNGGAVGAGPLRPVPSRDAGIAERGVGSLRQSCGKMPVHHLSARFLFVLEHAGIALEHAGELGNLSGTHGNTRDIPGSPRSEWIPARITLGESRAEHIRCPPCAAGRAPLPNGSCRNRPPFGCRPVG